MNSQTYASTDNNKQRLVLYFQVHQPKRLSKFNFFSIGSHPEYFDDALDGEIVQRVAKDSYLDANTLLLDLIKKHPAIKVCFSLSGGVMDQFEQYAPNVLESFKALADTGNVEFLSETNYHSLSSLLSEEEFQTQVLEHAEKIQKHFGQHPAVFRNTELIYSDAIGSRIAKMGFRGVITDGVERVLEGRSSFEVYNHPEQSDFKVLLRNNKLSDTIAFRFRENGIMLTADKYVQEVCKASQAGSIVTLAMDYETFGEHHKKESGILDFLKSFLTQLVKEDRIILAKASEALSAATSTETLSIPEAISWADEKKDLSAWLGNDMQRDAFDILKSLEASIKRSANQELITTWRNLQTSDHFYYMCTKKLNDGDVHSYFSHYPSPYEAFINYMNVLSDFVIKVKSQSTHADLSKAAKQNEYERQHSEVPVWAEQQRATYTQEVFISH
jgi:alpha-amylase